MKDDSEIAQADNSVQSLELEVLKNEMLSRIKAEMNDQDLAEARAKLKSLREGYPLKRAAAAAELRILEIRRDRAKAAMEHATDNAKAMTVISPLDGLVVPKITWRGNGPADIQEGDEMWPGAPVLQVVNQSLDAGPGAYQPGRPAVVRSASRSPSASTPIPTCRCPAASRRSRPLAFRDRSRPAFVPSAAVITVEGRTRDFFPI